jgi:hypothetical protein
MVGVKLADCTGGARVHERDDVGWGCASRRVEYLSAPGHGVPGVRGRGEVRRAGWRAH